MIEKMKMVFRWFGSSDPVTLDKIRQIPCVSGVVSAIYDTPVGEVWSEESVMNLKKISQDAGLEFEVVESVPVHEEIKLGSEKADALIDNYCENIRLLGKYGVKVICYNFMPVFDWMRTELSRLNTDGSNSLAYDHKVLSAIDPHKGGFSLPGWDESYTNSELSLLLKRYEAVDEEKLWGNLEKFLKKIIPVAEECGVKMAIHPDDPPWSIFGLPRIITNEENIERFLKLVDSPANGLTLCTGSLGVSRDNDIVHMINQFSDRIYFAHLRNIAYTSESSFQETAHPSQCGSLDMYSIVKALYDGGFDGYIRPDHGRMIWGETGRPGYGLYDRALGAVYLLGLWEAISKNADQKHDR